MPRRKLLCDMSERHFRRLLQAKRRTVIDKYAHRTENDADNRPLSETEVCIEPDRNTGNSPDATVECTSPAASPSATPEASEIGEEPNDGQVTTSPDTVSSESSTSNAQSSEEHLTDVEITFKEHLANWAVSHGITQAALSDLLLLLRREPGFANLPKHARTLLQTPKTTVIYELPPGEYCHFGIAPGILQFVEKHTTKNLTSIQLQIGIDGLPISNSNTSQLWPILGCIVPGNDVFLIGCYHGLKKPFEANEYLRRFVDEAKNLVEHGFEYDGTTYPFSVHSIICDAPAKAFVCLTKNHTGFFSCTKCTIKGKWIRNRVSFIEMSSSKRTDQSFMNQEQKEYHCGISILLEILNLGLVSAIPLDVMHLIFIGVMKKLISLWSKGTETFQRFSANVIEIISDALIQMRSHIPSEFARRPRDLGSYKQWKATELRLFLLYLAPFVMKGVLPEQFYHHLMELHVAVRLLSHQDLLHVDYAETLLIHFVECFALLYGREYISHNVHALIHLADDVRNLGPIDTFSAFRYENHMGKLKKLLRKSERPLQQLNNRYKEISNCLRLVNNHKQRAEVSGEHNYGPLVPGCGDPQFKKLCYRSFTLTIAHPNNCAGLKDGSIIVIDNIATSAIHGKVVVGRRFEKMDVLYTKPCESSLLGCFKVSRLSGLEQWPITSVTTKYMKIPVDNAFAVLPLLHLH